MSDLTDARGSVYGPPHEHFARTVAILAVVFGDTPVSDLRPEDWSVVMVCDKLARWSHTREHDDSIADVGGYAETWRLVKEAMPRQSDSGGDARGDTIGSGSADCGGD